ncbi:acyl-CoA thioesterase [Dehalococcoidia bacterium]|nr:acyl-CoA thioesterase [Dehalococcoidia bacterium]
MEGDAQGIVFNGAYLNYLEIAQAEYFRNLGFSIYQIAKSGYFDSAVVKTTIEFKKPAKIDQLIDLYTRIVTIGTTSITLDLEIYPNNSDQMLTSIQAIYVGYNSTTGDTRVVPEAIRTLVNHFESTGTIKDLNQFSDLSQAAFEQNTP